MQLDFWDINYCYNLMFSKSEGRWNPKGRTGSLALVLGLWDSCKYMFNDTVIIKGNVEPDLTGHLVPRQPGAPGS